MPTKEKWEIRFKPRQLGDKAPWQVFCPYEMPEWAYYEQGWRCGCRRFKKHRLALAYVGKQFEGES